MAKSRVSPKDTLKTRISKIEKLRKELSDEEKSTSKQVMSTLKELMKSNPLLKAIRWQQYTPHFNDGDTCEFGIHGLYYKFDETIQPEKETNDYYDGFLYIYNVNESDFFKSRTDILNHEQMKSLEKTVKAINNTFDFLNSVEKGLENMFGNGVQVTVTADGVEVEDFDHD